MLHLYYSNHLEIQKAILVSLLKRNPLPDPFQSEQILVQSQGMAQWLKLQIAAECGVAANIDFPLPASFIWQQYHRTLPNVPQQNAFQKEAMLWHLLALIPDLLTDSDFIALKKYLGEPLEQEKLYQLASKIADLFDQYLVYRPEWIAAWEQQREQDILQPLQHGLSQNNQELSLLLQQDLQSAVCWQGKLWRALYARITQQSAEQGEHGYHRANLHSAYLQQLVQQLAKQPTTLPTQRLFIFGISALPTAYLQTFQALAQHCEVHLFFNNPCRYYWGDILDRTFLQKLQLRQRQAYLQTSENADARPWLNVQQQAQAAQDDWQNPLGYLQSGNPLLAAWGKMGRDFLSLLSQSEANEIDAYAAIEGDGLLAQLQNAILDLQPLQSPPPFVWQPEDQSLTIHACHSPMREVEILHDQLLHWFQQDRTLTPKDIVVMVADVDKYVPYIHAVFAQYGYQDARFIPYEIADRKHSHSDVIISTFLALLQLKESPFTAEAVLGLLDVAELRERFAIELSELATLKNWVAQNGIRYGLTTENQGEPNYNSWQSGLERMLLGTAMREADGVWQETVAFDFSFGLGAQLVGKLGEFLQQLQDWHALLQQAHSVADWQLALQNVLQQFFIDSDTSRHALLFLAQRIDEVFQTALETQFEGELSSEVVAELMNSRLSEEDNSFNFLNGKLSFCTLLPMRAIPFKVVALLGMNEGDYPRQHNPNSFDLMQYAPQKGDRVRRDDDRYLFLEAILSAQQKLYISYVGRSLTDNQALQPSVLVSQLVDYLVEQIAADDSGEVRSKLIQTHPMTVFSAENFKPHNPNRSFAKAWLAAAQEKQEMSDFVQPLAANPLQSAVIELDRLIRFVQDPLRYFFEKQLGVYFRQYDDSLAESEVFQLSKLENYQLKEQLLRQSTSEWAQQFNHAKYKGELPRAAFAEIAEQAISDELQPLGAAISPYLSQTAQTLAIDLVFEIDGQDYQLQGNIEHLYQGQQVRWRSGSVKAQHQIESWINYLAQCVQQQQTVATPHFYGIEKGKVSCLQFSEISVQQAQQQLSCYVADFLQAEQQLLLLPTALYPLFFADKAKTDEDLLQEIQQLAQDGFHEGDKADPYWQRLLSQQQELDLNAIKYKMQQWFGLMQQRLE